MVINLQNMEEWKLNAAVKLVTIEAWSKEEARGKVYAIAEDEQDPAEEQAHVGGFNPASHRPQLTLFMQQQQNYNNQRNPNNLTCQNTSWPQNPNSYKGLSNNF